ncbi:MAG: hypothetical protein JXQ72_06625 [Anaerolineae bacterium]|nr:hypothetical protein [Anaerolineae bacterium]
MIKGLHRSFITLALAGGLLIGAVAAVHPPTPPAAEASASAAPTVLVEALVGQIIKLNPLLATYNPVDRDITSLIFEGLTTTNTYGEIVPALAESWTVSPDGLQYFVQLRRDVLWQDGVPFNARDVAFTFQLLSDPQFPGAADVVDFWRTVEVDVLGGFLVRFRLTQPLGSFPDYLRTGIVPYHVLNGVPVDTLSQHPFNLAPIGTGPYQIDALTASDGQIDGVQLRAAPVYRQRPDGRDGYALDRIIFRTYPTFAAAMDAYRQGEVNSIGSVPPDQQAAVQALPGLSVYTAVAPTVGVLIYNWEHDSMGFVRNPRARIALAHALDRVGLVQDFLSGRAIPADSPLVPGSWAYVPGLEWPEYNLERARDLLVTANLIESEDAPSVVMALLTLDDPALVGMANSVAAAWRQFDFTVTVEAVDAATLRERLEAGNFDAAIIELGFAPNADPDPYVFWHQGQDQNYGGMDDRRISEALESARRDPVGLNRQAHYRIFQELFAERVPALALYYPLYVYTVDARLAGVEIGFLSSPADRFRTIRDWHFAD